MSGLVLLAPAFLDIAALRVPDLAQEVIEPVPIECSVQALERLILLDLLDYVLDRHIEAQLVSVLHHAGLIEEVFQHHPVKAALAGLFRRRTPSEAPPEGIERDRKSQNVLLEQGWRIGNVWECSLKGRGRIESTDVLHQLSKWLKSDAVSFTVEGLDWDTTETRA